MSVRSMGYYLYTMYERCRGMSWSRYLSLVENAHAQVLNDSVFPHLNNNASRHGIVRCEA